MKSISFPWLVVLLFWGFTQSVLAAALSIDAVQFKPGNTSIKSLLGIDSKQQPNIYLLALKTQADGTQARPQIFHLSPQLKTIPHKKRLALSQIIVGFEQETQTVELFFFHSNVLDKSKQIKNKKTSPFKTLTIKDILILDKKLRRESSVPFEAFRTGDRVLFQDYKHDFTVFGHYELQPNQLTEQVQFVANPPYLADYRLQQAVLDGLLVIELSVQ